MKNQPLTNEMGDVRELTEEDFKHFKSAAEVLPLSLRQKLNLQKAEKISTTMEFDRDVFEAFRTTGADWQNQINHILKQWLQTHSLEHSVL
jgi:uncharacterized protein (DUF4415 family)